MLVPMRREESDRSCNRERGVTAEPHLAPNALQLPCLVADPVEAVHAARIVIELQLVLDLLRADGPITQRTGMAIPGTRPHGLLRPTRKRSVLNAAASFLTQLLRIEKHALVHADYVASGVPEAGSWQVVTACRSMTWKGDVAPGWRGAASFTRRAAGAAAQNACD